MKSNSKNLTVKGIGERVGRWIMKNYLCLKPLFYWMSPQLRSRIKFGLLGPLFNFLYRSKDSWEIDYSLEKGANLIGYPRADIGEGEFLRQTAWAFIKSRVAFGIFDYHVGAKLSQNDIRLVSHIRSDNPYVANVFHLKPDQVEASVLTLGTSFVKERYNIGFWVWELSKFPELWLGPLEFLNEIWCPSTFVQDAIAEKTSKPTLYMPTSIDFPPPKDFSREYFKLPKAPYLFLFVFDFKSYYTRKNPLACIRAFRRAFPKGNEDDGIVIKSMGGDKYPDEYRQLAEEALKDSRIVLIDVMFQHEEVLGLMQVCDSFISLHRSEGIGLCLAQSMLLGKPVIATNYSGNIDFTLADNSCLVDFKLIPVKLGEYQFPEDQVWADPSIDHAADYMRRLVEDEAYRSKMANAGQSYIRTHHSSKSVGEIYRSRLAKLGLWDD